MSAKTKDIIKYIIHMMEKLTEVLDKHNKEVIMLVCK